MMNSVEIKDLRVLRGGRLVLPGISLTVPAGTVTGLLGPSGSGKTTLMRSVVGVQIIESGDVRVLGRPAGTPELRRRIGYLTQAPAVYADLTARENLHYFARIVDVAPSRIEEVLALIDLVERSDQVVHTMSGGERARVSLATTLLGEPEVLVLDEPTVGLDPVLRRNLWRTFHELADGSATFLVSSHVMDEAERCDQIILMLEGRIVATGTPKELLERGGTDDLEEAFIRLAEGS
jgi:ABC-2 type transport system ATP-binding protein